MSDASRISSSAIDPLTLELATSLPNARQKLAANWSARLGHPPFAWAGTDMSDLPIVASEVLLDEIDERVTSLITQIRPRLEQEYWKGKDAWQDAGNADVLCCDLAIVEEPESERGWDLRWVEFQTFTSVLASLRTLALAMQDIWPSLSNASAWDLPAGCTDWESTVQKWLMSEGTDKQTILLEHAPWQQVTRFDLAAASALWKIPVVEPSALTRERDTLLVALSGKKVEVKQIFNRMIAHEYKPLPEVLAQFNGVRCSWHNHPAWYYRVDKGLLPILALPHRERCANAYDWRTLDLAPESLVLKRIHSYGGTDVHLRVDATQLDNVRDPENWIVQPKYQPKAILQASDGAPLYGEIRCIIALPPNGMPWTPMRFMRLFRGTHASVRRRSGAPGEGISPIFSRPD